MTPIQLDPNHQTNSISDTTLEQAQANTRFAMQAHVTAINAAHVQDYEAQWQSYVASRDARPDATNIIVPSPTRAAVVYTDNLGWPYVDSSDKPVVAPHTYVPPKTTQQGWFNAGTTDAKPDVASLLMSAKLYGEPIVYSGMKFLRVA